MALSLALSARAKGVHGGSPTPALAVSLPWFVSAIVLCLAPALGPDMTSPGMTSPGMTSPGMTSPGMTSPGMTGPGTLAMTAVAAGGLVAAVAAHQVILTRALRAGPGRDRGGWLFAAQAMLTLLLAAVQLRGWALLAGLLAASSLLVLRGSRAVAVFSLIVLAQIPLAAASGEGARHAAAGGITVLAIGLALYCIQRLVRLARDLHLMRLALAETAVSAERLRFSRDLHDILGHDLATIALRGELGLRLVGTDAEQARAEIQHIVDVARGAIADVRAIADGYRRLSLRAEIDSAAKLLTAAGIECETYITIIPEFEAGAEAFAWALREGTTNIIRHSDARHCVIRTDTQDGLIWLELMNDGIRHSGERDVARTHYPERAGSGLTGLSERIGALGGRTAGASDGAGGYRLRVELPSGVPDARHRPFASDSAAEGAAVDQGPDRRGCPPAPRRAGRFTLTRAGH